MKLSNKRRQAIYAAVHEEIMTLRLKLNDRPEYNAAMDVEIAQAGTRAAEAAIKAAAGESH